jgi:hypothetical protein
MPDKAREESLGSTYGSKREMYRSMSKLAERAVYLIPRKCSKVDVPQNEFNARDLLIEAGAQGCEESSAPTFLVPGQCKKTGEEDKCNEDEDKIRHDD